MAQLPSVQDFELALCNILVPDNRLRADAEAFYNNAKKHPDYCITSLLYVLANSQRSEIRGLACVLLRKAIIKSDESLFPHVTAEVQQQIKQGLLIILEKETESTIRKKLVYAVAGLGSGLMETNEFPELLPTLFRWVKSPTPAHRESALGIFNQLATFMLDEGMEQYITVMRDVFGSCLADPESNKVRVAAVEATCSVVSVLDRPANRKHFQTLIPGLLQALAQILNANDQNAAETVVEALIEVAEVHPLWFKPAVADVMNAMFTIANTQTLSESVRQLGMEFMISMAEAAPSLCKKVPSFAQNVFGLAMNMMLDIEEDIEDWSKQTYDEEDEDDLTNYDVGLEALDRLSLSIGGELVQPVAFRLIPQFLSNTQDWKHRHAGLMALAQTAEGCAAEYAEHLEQILTMVLTLVTDQHPRVRYAAIHTCAQLSTDFSPELQKHYHQQVVPALLHGMNDQFVRVQSHSATSVVNFVEECPADCIEPYLDALITQLLRMLQSGNRFVQEQTLSAISAIAECAEDAFVKYYDAIMPLLKQILANATGKNDRVLRARSMEASALIGVAVGREKFYPDFQEIARVLMTINVDECDADDPIVPHFHQAWARFAKCLKELFVPYLQFVMPTLLKNADLKPEVIVTDADDVNNEEHEGMESITLSIKGVGDKRISIRTSILEDKVLACNMIYSYVYDLKEDFFPYIDSVAKLMVPLLQFAYLEEIRETAGTIMPVLLDAVKTAAEKGVCDISLVKQLLDFILATLLEALKNEGEVKTAGVLAETLHDCIEIAGDNCLNPQQLATVAQLLNSIIMESMERRKELTEALDNEEDEEEAARIDDDNTNEEEFLTLVADNMTALFKTHAENFAPLYIQYLHPIYSNMLNPAMPEVDRRIGLCVMCDLVEHGGNAAAPFAASIFQAFLSYAGDASAQVRQAAVYGIGACAEKAGELFEPFVGDAVRQLMACIQRLDASDKKNASATANAVSALYKIATRRATSPGVDAAQLMQFWLNSMPVAGDKIEAKVVHSYLLDNIEKQHPVITQTNNIPKIVQVFADILDTDLIYDEDEKRAVAILKQFQATLPPQVLQSTWGALSNKQRNNLQRAMQ